jgi:hypothetical protein
LQNYVDTLNFSGYVPCSKQKNMQVTYAWFTQETYAANRMPIWTALGYGKLKMNVNGSLSRKQIKDVWVMLSETILLRWFALCWSSCQFVMMWRKPRPQLF